MYRFVTIFLLALSMSPVFAQDGHSPDAEDESHVDLFDEDTERTEKGWSRFYAAAGATQVDADGGFGVKLPTGDSVNIIDFDRVGLKESDASYWLSLQWRSADSRWGAWFASWQYDVTGSRQW